MGVVKKEKVVVKLDRNVIMNILTSYGVDVAKEEIKQFYPEMSETFLEDTKNLCNLYLKLLKTNSDAAYALGTNIIFNLRKIIMKKDIIIYIGATNNNNNNLKISEINLSDLINNPEKFRITDSAFELQSQIENYNNLLNNAQKSQSAV